MSEMTFRQYDPAIGRFNGMDRLAELTYSLTPYRFALNNPIVWSDPTGLFETRKEARQYRREHGYRGQIKKQEDGSYGLFASNGFHYEAGDDSSLALNDLNPNDGVIQSVLVEANKSGSDNSNVNSSKAADPLFWINGGLGVASTYTGYKADFLTRNELWHKSDNGKLHSVLDKSWNKTKYRNVREHQVGKVQLPRNISNGLAATSIVMTGVNVYRTGELKASDVLYTTMAGVSFTGVGSVVAGIFFVADLATMGTSYLINGEAKSIGDYLDESTNGGVILNKNDFD